jgi:radical SAM superfamily enzyme YgiQ (UPF0313 family)
MDLAQRNPEYIEELARHHVGGHLKVAPEHTDPGVLALMKKPCGEDYDAFAAKFAAASARAGKRQVLIPYYIASHPGSDLAAMIHLACYLKQTGNRPDQVQDFIPSPFDIAACMYYTGLDPMTGKPVYVARGGRQRRLQRALLQFWKPEHYFDVRQALEEAGRADLIGEEPDSLIPSRPPREALGRRPENRSRGKRQRRSGSTSGYRPHRKTAARRERQ